eukprot:TRINITY_DN101726_c0_g1_i1.p1 TRINITY_DN101726_c0_g1~~TRINITY_DN101726_c0_g1_i1.p1  ORF type:complete len:681 (-),score=151.76 TRINITY_DN101726_c0_g1_i1:187-2229(-)
MHPVAYFAARLLTTWLQFLERRERAFVRSTALLTAAGVLHSWAVVYALFVAIHTRAMRHRQQVSYTSANYAEHLPSWVSFVEVITQISMIIWWIAGWTISLLRLVDEDAEGLPMDKSDTDVPAALRWIRSPQCRTLLKLTHAVSAVGLFSSIVLLCASALVMVGSTTVCEFCLVVVAAVFTAPHTLLAVAQLQGLEANGMFLAAAAEAAIVGPQLCVILALADSPGHAHGWQNCIYVLSFVLFVGTVVSCVNVPRKGHGIAVPPEFGEFIACPVLNVAGMALTFLCFPALNSWPMWGCAGVFAIAFALLLVGEVRNILLEMLEPVFILQSNETDVHEVVQKKDFLSRRRWRHFAIGGALLCAAAGLWDVMIHVPSKTADNSYAEDRYKNSHFWSDNSNFLLRWKASLAGPAEGDQGDAFQKQLLEAAADALGHPDYSGSFHVLGVNASQRVIVFKWYGYDDQRTVHLKDDWEKALRDLKPDSKLGELVEAVPIKTLEDSMCMDLERSATAFREQEEERQMKANGTWVEKVFAEQGLRVRQKTTGKEGTIVEGQYEMFNVKFDGEESAMEDNAFIEEFETADGKGLLPLWEASTSTDAPIPVDVILKDYSAEDRIIVEAGCMLWHGSFGNYGRHYRDWDHDYGFRDNDADADDQGEGGPDVPEGEDKSEEDEEEVDEHNDV